MPTEDYDRFPGNVCRTPIPNCHAGVISTEQLEIVQSYKGFALVACRKPYCDAVMIYEIADEDTIWSCDGCATRAFQALYDQPARPSFRAIAVRHVPQLAA